MLLHGWPQHWYEWRHQIPVLAEHYRVICPDLRGFGWSDAPPGGYDKETLAADVVNLLDALGLDRVKLIGHDWGGWVGFLLCIDPPRAGRALPRAQHPAALGQDRPAHVRGLLALLVPGRDREPLARRAG